MVPPCVRARGWPARSRAAVHPWLRATSRAVRMSPSASFLVLPCSPSTGALARRREGVSCRRAYAVRVLGVRGALGLKTHRGPFQGARKPEFAPARSGSTGKSGAL